MVIAQAFGTDDCRRFDLTISIHADGMTDIETIY